jgi:VanZ family protein
MRGMPLMFGLCIIFTTIMALLPNTEVPHIFNLWDKSQHALAFAALSLTGCLAYIHKVKVVCLGLLAYGASIEVMQSTFTTTRFGEASDLLADSVGILIGFILYLLAKKANKLTFM